MATPAVEFRHVRYRYPSAATPILNGVDFTLEEGGYAGVIGGNGSGKTTILRLMLGLLTPEQGEILLGGKPLNDFREWRTVGYVPQIVSKESRVFPATVWEIVESGHADPDFSPLCQFGVAGCETMTEALRIAEVEHLRNRRIGELSGGERQRVFIARALVSRPRLLVLDEPTASMDEPSQEKFYAFLRDLNGRHGITVILVSHDLERVDREVSTVFILEGGRIRRRRETTD